MWHYTALQRKLMEHLSFLLADAAMHLKWAGCPVSISETFHAIEEESKYRTKKVSADKGLMEWYHVAFPMKNQHGKAIQPASWYLVPHSRVQKEKSSPLLLWSLIWGGDFWSWHSYPCCNWVKQQNALWNSYFPITSALKPCGKKVGFCCFFFCWLSFKKTVPLVMNMRNR